MSAEEEDDFWNRSDVKAFNFDDEDQLQSGSNQRTSNLHGLPIGPGKSSESPGLKTLNSILAAKTSSNEPFLRPSMIMCNGDKIEQLIEHLDETILVNHSNPPKHDPKTYIREIVDRRIPIDFSPYKSRKEKLLLLDCAICCSDGNTITAVTIFISKTLKSEIFIEELKRRPIAIDHYINYLEMTGRRREATEFSEKLLAT